MKTASGPFLRASGRRSLPVVHQAVTTECGLACIAMIAAYFGAPTDLDSLRRQNSASLRGTTLHGLMRACRRVGLSTRAVRCAADELGRLRLPCVLHWRFDHFVVLRSATADSVVIHDPARGVVTEPMQILREAFTGVALEVKPTSAFRASPPPMRLRVRDLLPKKPGLGREFSAGILLAFAGEILAIVAPYYLQLVIDHVIGKGDAGLLNALAFAFAMLLLFQIAAGVLRQLTFQYVGQVLAFDMTARLLGRLFELPSRFFRSRDLGDIQHRVQAMSRIQTFVATTAPMLVLDLVFLLLVVIVMTLHDPYLTLLNLAAAGSWCVWRAAILPWSLRLSGDIARAEAAVQSHLLESLRVMPSIKSANGESIREAEWGDRFAETVNARIRAGNLGVADSAVQQFLFNGVRIATVFLLARQGLNGETTIGTISAFAAWLGMFSARSAAIVDRIVEYRLLRVPLTRLADLVFNETENDGKHSGAVGSLQLQGVSYRYGLDEPPVLRDCSLSVGPGEFIAIAGASGSGKSTLLQIFAGLEPPSYGEFRIGGRPVAQWSRIDLRSRIATVLQDDRLLKGSVADNIALFDTDIDRQRMHAAAAFACIEAEIEALPMGFETRIGDLGSSLSRGQIQRVLLARAWYRQPELLLIDEGTSGLDPDLERRVIDNLSGLDATRIVVTHSDRMLSAADAVWWLHDGRLLSSPPAPHR